MVPIFDIISRSENETEAAGIKLGNKIITKNDQFSFIAMYGELGAGKTAFIRGLASVLTPGAVVSSPTYSLINIYSDERYILFHLDLYRITGEDDLFSIGFDELFLKNSKKVVIAAEWCENIFSLLPENYIRVVFTKADVNIRVIKAEAITGDKIC